MSSSVDHLRELNIKMESFLHATSAYSDGLSPFPLEELDRVLAAFHESGTVLLQSIQHDGYDPALESELYDCETNVLRLQLSLNRLNGIDEDPMAEPPASESHCPVAAAL